MRVAQLFMLLLLYSVNFKSVDLNESCRSTVVISTVISVITWLYYFSIACT